VLWGGKEKMEYVNVLEKRQPEGQLEILIGRRKHFNSCILFIITIINLHYKITWKM
jgi:hypothetical protein